MIICPKIGPLNWKQVLERTKTKCCEVWFRLEWAKKYQPMFDYLNQHQIKFGLHFWAVLPGGFEPNLAFDKEKIADQTETLIKDNIKIAHQVKAKYLNVHPGSLTLKKINFDQQRLTVLKGKEIDHDKAWLSVKTRTKRLTDYARKQGVRFLVETLPKNEAQHWRNEQGRLKPQKAKNISPEMIINLAKTGVYITNDFSHTAASWETTDRQQLFKNLLQVTKQLFHQTKLLHLNTIIPPFNGTDSHNGILTKDFKQQVFPNKQQLIKLLSLFKKRKDLWIIIEVAVENMVENYFQGQKLVSQLR